jgi:thermostable 8-oxoguanine DNA glycosylase
MNTEEIKHLFVPVTERLPEISNENYYTISEKGNITNRFFNGKRFESAHYEGEITHWLDFCLLTTKSRAVEFLKDYLKEVREEFYEINLYYLYFSLDCFITENQNKL